MLVSHARNINVAAMPLDHRPVALIIAVNKVFILTLSFVSVSVYRRFRTRSRQGLLPMIYAPYPWSLIAQKIERRDEAQYERGMGLLWKSNDAKSGRAMAFIKCGQKIMPLLIKCEMKFDYRPFDGSDAKCNCLYLGPCTDLVELLRIKRTWAYKEQYMYTGVPSC